jgi:putative FmdB family regulatory protein
MPIYEYLCEQCGVFEETQRITDAALTRCPRCRRKVRRLISQTSFQLKGGGWYVTDYARSGQKNGGKEGGAEGAKAEGKSEAKGDGVSAPAPATPAKSESSSSDKAST